MVNGTLELALFRLKKPRLGETFLANDTIHQPYKDALTLFRRGWDAIKDPESDDNSTCYRDVYLLGNGTNPRVRPGPKP